MAYRFDGASLQPGDVVVAEVVQVEHYGAFMRCGDLRLIVLVIDLGLGAGCLPSSLLSVGDEVRVRVILYSSADDVYRVELLAKVGGRSSPEGV